MNLSVRVTGYFSINFFRIIIKKYLDAWGATASKVLKSLLHDSNVTTTSRMTNTKKYECRAAMQLKLFIHFVPYIILGS